MNHDNELLKTIQTYGYCQLCELSMDKLRSINKYYALKPCKTKRQLAQNIARHLRNTRLICPICVDVIEDRYKVITECQHAFCDICILQHFKTSLQCPMCRTTCTYMKIINQMNNARLMEINHKSKGIAANQPLSIFHSPSLFIAALIVMFVFIIEILFILAISYLIANLVYDYYTKEILKNAMVALY